MFGDHRFDDRLANDISDDYRARERAFYRRYLDRVKAFSGVSGQIIRREIRNRNLA
jgi:hypothetical protein